MPIVSITCHGAHPARQRGRVSAASRWAALASWVVIGQLPGCHAILPLGSSEHDGTTSSTDALKGEGGVSLDGAAGSTCKFHLVGNDARVAFCESFAVQSGDGGRSGDLDPSVWSVSRRSSINNVGQGLLNFWPTATVEGCGATSPSPPPKDVRVCNGRLHEASNDGGSMTILALSLLRPFDWANRIGTVVFDVTADSVGTLGAWPMVWLTEQQAPAPFGRQLGSGDAPDIRNGLGVELAGTSCQGDASKVGVSSIFVSRNYVSQMAQLSKLGCVAKATGTGALNHFELRISQSRVEVWGTDPGADNLAQLAVADGLDLPLTRGLLHFEDVHNAAAKNPDPSHTDHTLVWDNIGFDGPKVAGNAVFEVPDAGDSRSSEGLPGTNLGHEVTASAVAFATKAVAWDQPPEGAVVGFNWFPTDKAVPSVRVNGGKWQATPWPFDAMTYCWRAITVPVPMSDVVQGAQQIQLQYTGAQPSTVVSNVSLVLLGASKVAD